VGGELTSQTAANGVVLINNVKNSKLAFRMDFRKVTMILDPFFLLNLHPGVTQWDWPIQIYLR
jgi:hypothetical protein